jgi:hypothetical protein
MQHSLLIMQKEGPPVIAKPGFANATMLRRKTGEHTGCGRDAGYDGRCHHTPDP